MQRHRASESIGQNLSAGGMFRQDRDQNELPERVSNQQNDLHHSCGHSLVTLISSKRCPPIYAHMGPFKPFRNGCLYFYVSYLIGKVTWYHVYSGSIQITFIVCPLPSTGFSIDKWTFNLTANPDFSDQYIYCFYWSTLTLTAIGEVWSLYRLYIQPIYIRCLFRRIMYICIDAIGRIRWG